MNTNYTVLTTGLSNYTIYRNAKYRKLKIAVASYVEFLRDKLNKQNTLLAQVSDPEFSSSQDPNIGISPEERIDKDFFGSIPIYDEDLMAYDVKYLTVEDYVKCLTSEAEKVEVTSNYSGLQQEIDAGTITAALQSSIDDVQSQIVIYTYIASSQMDAKPAVSDILQTFESEGFPVTDVAREYMDQISNVSTVQQCVEVLAQQSIDSVGSFKSRKFSNLQDYSGYSGLGVFTANVKEVIKAAKDGVEVVLDKLSTALTAIMNGIKDTIQPVISTVVKLFGEYNVDPFYNIESIDVPIFAIECVRRKHLSSFNQKIADIPINKQSVVNGIGSYSLEIYNNNASENTKLYNLMREELIQSTNKYSLEDRKKYCVNYIVPTSWGFIEMIAHYPGFPSLSVQAYENNMIGYENPEVNEICYSFYGYKGLWAKTDDVDDSLNVNTYYSDEKMKWVTEISHREFDSETFKTMPSVINLPSLPNSNNSLALSVKESLFNYDSENGFGYLSNPADYNFMSRVDWNKLHLPTGMQSGGDYLPVDIIESFLEVHPYEYIPLPDYEGNWRRIKGYYRVLSLATGIPALNLIGYSQEALHKLVLQNQEAKRPAFSTFEGSSETWLYDKKYDRIITPSGYLGPQEELISIEDIISALPTNYEPAIQLQTDDDYDYFYNQNIIALYMAIMCNNYVETFVVENCRMKIDGLLNFRSDSFIASELHDGYTDLLISDYTENEGNVFYLDQKYQPYYANTNPKLMISCKTDFQRGFESFLVIAAVIAAVIATVTIVSGFRLKKKVKLWAVKRQAMANNANLNLQAALKETPVDKKKVAKLTKTSFKAQKKLNFATKLRDAIVGKKQDAPKVVEQAIQSRYEFPSGEYDLAFSILSQCINGTTIDE